MAERDGKEQRLAEMAAAQEQVAPDFAAADQGAFDFVTRLPRPCPVTPLGVMGNKIVFLDGLQQLQTASTKCEKGDCVLWFGDEYLHDNFENSGKSQDRWNQRQLQEAFLMECRDRGPFDPSGKVFGRGAHRSPNGGPELVLHMGRDVLIADPGATSTADQTKIVPAGEIRLREERLFYPAAAPLPAPAIKPAPRIYAEELRDALSTFEFVHDKVAPLILTGMVAQMFICGALEWRSHLWLTAPTGAGKTTMQNMIRACLGQWCLHTEDATEAAIRGVLKDDTLPVLIDEAEAHDNPERLQKLINLIKKASSGSKLHRGTVDGGANEFTSQSSFFLSSVLHAPLRGEDRNRMAIIEMRARGPDAHSEPPNRALWRSRGPMLHRRMVAHWYRWEATYDAYKREIARLGFESRAQDTYGTLLASADLMLYDNPFSAAPFDDDEPGAGRVNEAVRLCVPLMQRSREEAETDDVRARRLLLSTHLPGAGGNPSEPISVWIERAMEPLDGEPNDAARRKLLSYGLSVVELTYNPHASSYGSRQARPGEWRKSYLAIASMAHRGLAELLKGSDWAGGNLEQSLGRIEGAATAKVRFLGQTVKAVCVPLETMMFMDRESDAEIG